MRYFCLFLLHKQHFTLFHFICHSCICLLFFCRLLFVIGVVSPTSPCASCFVSSFIFCPLVIVFVLYFCINIITIIIISPTSSCARRMGASTESDFARWRPDWDRNVQNDRGSWSHNTLRLYIGDVPKSVSPYLTKLSSLKKIAAPNL